jgi:hypothetical protein
MYQNMHTGNFNTLVSLVVQRIMSNNMYAPPTQRNLNGLEYYMYIHQIFVHALIVYLTTTRFR